VATILNRWHRPLRGRDAGARRADPVLDPPRVAAPPSPGQAGVTRTWVLLMVGLLVFAAGSAVVILAR
jgi:hypothetical protein